MTHTLFVCIGCGAKEGKTSAGRGVVVADKLEALLRDESDIRVQRVSCLSNCDRGVSVALSAEGKFGWVFGEKSESDEDVEAVVKAARAYAVTSDGFIAKTDRARPVIARLPPAGFVQD
jgi:predicted metal-binding protein